jgi:hypothetical protein
MTRLLTITLLALPLLFATGGRANTAALGTSSPLGLTDAPCPTCKPWIYDICIIGAIEHYDFCDDSSPSCRF